MRVPKDATVSVESMDAFKESIHTLKSIINHLGDGVFIIDTELKAQLINPSAARIAQDAYGIQIKEGDSMLYSFPEYRHLDLLTHYKQALDGETVDYEIEIKETEVWLHCVLTPIQDRSGKVTGIYGRARDITDKKQLEKMEAQRREAENISRQYYLLFEQFMAHSPLVGWITDERGIMQYMNPYFLKTYGFTEIDLGRSIYELFPDQIAVDYHINNMRVIRGGKAIETIEIGQLADGTKQVMRIYKFPIVLEGLSMVAGWGVDVTRSNELQEALQKSVELYRNLNEATSDAIYDWNVTANTISKGNGFSTLFGSTQMEGSLQDQLKEINSKDRDRIRGLYAAALKDPLAEKWSLEYNYRCKDGTYKNVIDKALIKREEGKAVRVIGALQDVTEQKQLQEELVKQEKETKREIVRYIIETQEKERRKLSVELHDNVNQMLASCKLMLEVACDGGGNAKDLTQKAYQNLSRVITEIRKISHELNPSALEDVGLVEAIREMVEEVNSTGRLSVKFIHSGWEKAHLAEADRIAIYRLVQEQMNNILKHSKASEAFIDLSLERGKVQLLIEDNGVGFDVSGVKKGVGLKNIRNRVDYYRGMFNLHSEKGKGTLAAIRLTLEG